MCPGPRRRARCGAGFTLLELLVVLGVLGVAAGGVLMALSDPQALALEREAARLVAQLEAARAESRATGQVRHWTATATGYTFGPDAPTDTPEQPWLQPGTRARVTAPADSAALSLGPEPVLAPQRLRLTLGAAWVEIGTDGLHPFALLPAPAPAAAPP